MKTMDSAAIEEEIVERLENSESLDDIILDLCEQENIAWPEAEAIVQRIQAENKTHIVLTQSPVLVLIALATFLGGLGLISVAVYDIVTVFNAYVGSGIASIGFLAYLLQYGGFFWGLGLLGLAMIVGSLRGMQDVWTAIFEKLGILQN
jgi:hypothetical protein